MKSNFSEIDYEGSIANMGLRHEDGSVCYIIGVNKEFREKLGIQDGDSLDVTVDFL